MPWLSLRNPDGNSRARPRLLLTKGLCSSSSRPQGCSSGRCCAPAPGCAKPKPLLMSSPPFSSPYRDPWGGDGWGSACGQDTFARHFCRTPANTWRLQNLKPWTIPKLTLPAANCHPSVQPAGPWSPAGCPWDTSPASAQGLPQGPGHGHAASSIPILRLSVPSPPPRPCSGTASSHSPSSASSSPYPAQTLFLMMCKLA